METLETSSQKTLEMHIAEAKAIIAAWRRGGKSPTLAEQDIIFASLKEVEEAWSKARQELEQHVTERTINLTNDNQQLQRNLQESEDRFHAAQELSLEGFTILRAIRDATFRIIDFEWTYVNPAAGQLLKHPPEYLCGRRLLDVLPGNQANLSLFARYVHVVETGQGNEVELQYQSDKIDGWFRNMAIKLGDGVAVSFSNITAQKLAEIERERLIGELQDALATVKRLTGLLPICASCKNIRNDQGYWENVESYIHDHADVQFTHGICPDCLKKMYPPEQYPDLYQDLASGHSQTQELS